MAFEYNTDMFALNVITVSQIYFQQAPRLAHFSAGAAPPPPRGCPAEPPWRLEGVVTPSCLPSAFHPHSQYYRQPRRPPLRRWTCKPPPLLIIRAQLGDGASREGLSVSERKVMG
jgi:hypothetical protein